MINGKWTFCMIVAAISMGVSALVLGADEAQAPPAAMVYVMKQIDKGLDEAQESVDAKDLNGAKASFGTATQQWEAQQEWNKGKYDPKHPDIVALAAKYSRVKASVEALEGKASQTQENLPVVMVAITDSSQKLEEAHQKANRSMRGLSSLMSTFDSGRESDVNKLRIKVDELRLQVEEVNALMPDALAAAKAFRKQFPDFNELDKLARNGRSAGQAVERLEKFPDRWLEEINRMIGEALEMAAENIKQHGLDKLKYLEGKDANRKKIAAASADKWVIDYSTFLLEVVPAVLPKFSPKAEGQFPKFVKARQTSLKRTEPMRADIKKIASAIGKARKQVVDAEKRRLTRARFPKTEFTGTKWSTADKDIRIAWAKAIGDKKILKVSIYSPWKERSEARWKNNHWVVGNYRYIGANCLAKLPSGKYMVYRMSFRNKRKADNTWGELKHWGIGHVYEILKENIDK